VKNNPTKNRIFPIAINLIAKPMRHLLRDSKPQQTYDESKNNTIPKHTKIKPRQISPTPIF
jgi:hypothetical protein